MENIIRELVVLGFFGQEIATVLEISIPWLTSLKQRNGIVTPKKRPAYGDRIKRYSDLLIRKRQGRLVDWEESLFHYLKALLEIDELEKMLEDYSETLAKEFLPEWVFQEPGYRNLLYDVFGISAEVVPIYVGNFLENYFLDLKEGSGSAPDSFDDLHRTLTARLTVYYSTTFPNLWEDARNRILEALSLLENEVTQGIFKLYYGLDGYEPLKFAKVGEELGMTGSRASQERRQGLSRLRHPKIIKHLRLLIGPRSRLSLRREKELRDEAAERKKIQESAPDITLLLESVDYLELPVRAAMCLAVANIEKIGDLVQMNPEELLNLKNFGRKSLRDVKEALEELDLEVETVLDKKTLKAFEKLKM